MKTEAMDTPIVKASLQQFGSRKLLICASLLLALCGTSCRLVKTAVDAPGNTVRAIKGTTTLDPVEVQQQLLRFAGEYSARITFGVDKLHRETNEAANAAERLHWKIALTTETLSIASGPNAVASLLDMTVFVTVTRSVMEDYWQPAVFGASAQPLVEGCRTAETNIWALAGKILTAQQQKEFRKTIELWRSQNPQPEVVLAARASGFASRIVAAHKEDTAPADSVSGLLSVDPLAGMEPAVREVTQTRLLAERGLFVARQMPNILRWQTELLSLNTMAIPAVRQLITNSTQISSSVERFVALGEKLPGQISSERQEILKALEAQEQKLTPLVSEVRQTLATGSLMSTSLNVTLTTFDALMKRFGVGETNDARPARTNAAPFRIQDYGQTAAQLEATARQLTALLVTLDQTIGSTNLAQLSAQVGPAVQKAEAGGKAITDYAFRKALLFLWIACGAVLITLLVFRFLCARLVSSGTKAKSP